MATTVNPRIRVREATPADAEAITDIHFGAFDDNIMNRLMYPNGVSEDSKKKFRTRLFPSNSPQVDGESDAARQPQTLLWVAEYFPEDAAAADKPGEIVAYSKWQLNRVQQTEEEWKKDSPATAEVWGEGCDLAVVDAFIGAMNRKQREHAKGEPALLLGLLACKPGRQRLGAGSALLRRGIELADRLGLPCRLEATPVGYYLYRKYGFEDVDVLDVNVTERWGVVNEDGSYWGADNAVAIAGRAPEGVMRTVIMRRPARQPESAA